MVQNLKFIKSLNKIKNLPSLIIKNNLFLYKLIDINLIDGNNNKILFLKENKKFISHNYLNYSRFLNYNIRSYCLNDIDFSLLFQYKQFFLNKVYTNYNPSMLYSLALLKVDTESVFDLDSNNIINIRKPFKSSNSTLLKKTNLIDAILKKYIETTLNTRVSLNFDKYNITFVRKKSIFLRILKRRMQRINRLLRHSNLTLRNFIRITFIFLCTKDLDLFSKILLNTMNSMHYKNHRRFLYYLKLFITKSIYFYFEVLQFEGFFFYLSGKISGGGNSKKKHYVVKHGKYSLTNKMLKLKYKKGLIHTKTGVMGYRFMVSYK